MFQYDLDQQVGKMKWKRECWFSKFWELAEEAALWYLFHQKPKGIRMDIENWIAEHRGGGVLMDSYEREEATEFIEQSAKHHFLLPFTSIFLYLVDVGII